MYGMNSVADKRTEAEGFLVHSVFYTIQGEGPWAGLPTIFLRLAGCNLQCSFCFVGDTRITMADASTKRIDAVQAGDMILAYDTLTEQFTAKRVIRTMQSKAKELIFVRTAEAEADNLVINETLATPEHPFLVKHKGWVKAINLRSNDRLTPLDTQVKSTVIEAALISHQDKAWTEYLEQDTVYNLEVEDWHTYVANGKVVHNCDTEFTEGAESYSLQNLALYLRNMAFTHNCNRIVITGGEPMLQPLTNLINNLPNMAFQIETAGTVWPSQFEAAIDKHNVLIVCSPKTPKVHPQIRARCLHFKYIIDARMLYTANGIPENVFFPDCLTEEKLVIYMQPCDVPDAKQARANITHAVNLALEHGYRLSIQIHKIAEVP